MLLCAAVQLRERNRTRVLTGNVLARQQADVPCILKAFRCILQAFMPHRAQTGKVEQVDGGALQHHIPRHMPVE